MNLISSTTANLVPLNPSSPRKFFAFLPILYRFKEPFQLRSVAVWHLDAKYLPQRSEHVDCAFPIAFPAQQIAQVEQDFNFV